MAVLHDQSATLSTGTGATTIVVTWGTLPTAGAKAFVIIGFTNGVSPTSLSDNGVTPATWVKDVDNGTIEQLWRADGITLPSSGSFAVTAHFAASSGDFHGGGSTFTGLATGGPTSSNGTATGTSLSVNTGNLTPVTSGDLKVGGFGDDTGSATQSITLTTGSAVSMFSNGNGNTAFAGAGAYHITTAATAQSLAWTLTGTAPDWATVYAVYAQTTGTTATAALATGVGKALQPTGQNAGLAHGTGTAQQPVMLVQPGAALASASGVSRQPNVVVGTIVQPSLLTGIGAALAPVPVLTVLSGLAHGTGTALQISAPAGLAHGTGIGQQPKPNVIPKALLAAGVGTAQTVTPKLIRNPLNLGALLTEQVPDGSLALTNLFGALLTEHSPDATLALLDFDAVLTGWTMQGPTPLTLSEFNDVTINIAVTNNGSPYNLTGVTLNLLLKTKAGTPDANALTFSSAGGSPAITVTNAVGGLANAVIPNTDLEAETYNFYRLDVVASGLTNTTLYGPITWITL